MAASDAPRKSNVKPQADNVVSLVKAYAKQETLGPLRGAGRWLLFGALGALQLGLAIVLLVLGVLRLLQTEASGTFDGSWAILAYLIALVVCLAAIGLALSRINKTTLSKDPR